MPRLKRLVKPLLLRRLKRDVLTDLPEKEEITVPVVMGEEERHAYEATRQNAVAKLKSGDRQNKIAILAELTRLRRFCCHPSLVMPAVQVSAKLERLCELLEGLRANNHRALVFSQFVDCLAIVRRALDERGWTYKLKLDYLTDEGKGIFFQRYFKTPLTDEERSRLNGIANLTPGDFRTVRESLYYLSDRQTNAARLNALEAESEAKGLQRAKIGF